MPGLRVAVFNDTRERGHYGCEAVMDVLLEQLEAHDLYPVFLWPVGQDWRKRRDALPAPGTIDAIVVNGEGSIHHSKERPRANCLADLAELSREVYGVPSFMMNATLHENSESLYKKLAGFDAVYVRDGGSLAELQRHGVSGKIVPDLTFNLAVEPRQSRRQGIGVIDSVDRAISPKLCAFASGTNAEFMPMQAPRPIQGARGLRHPVRYVRKLKTYMREQIACRSRPADVPGFHSWLQDKRLVVTGRYHAVTMCLGTATPFIACDSNTPKISWLLHDIFGNDHRMADPDTLETDLHSDFSPLEKQQLDTFLSHATRAAREMFDEIAAITHNPGLVRKAQ